MLHFHICQQQPIVNKRSYSKMTIDEIYEHINELDTWLSVIHDNTAVWCENVPIIEFYWYFVTWYRIYDGGTVIDFVYDTVDHWEPILTFKYDHLFDLWKIDSIWMCNNSPIIASKFDFDNAIKHLFKELSNMLEI